MIKVNAEIDFTRIRKYHPSLEYIASATENRNAPIDAIFQDIFIDVPSKKAYDKFLIDFEQLLQENDLKDNNALEIMLLVQQTYSDIELAREINIERLEVDVNLTFLTDLIKLQESATARKSKEPSTGSNLPSFNGLTLEFTSIDGSAVLKNSIVSDFLISQIIKAFKDPTYNLQLSTRLLNQEITSKNLTRIHKELQYRTNSVERFCTAETAISILQYLNNETSFSYKPDGMSNKQARFIFDLLGLFNLSKHIADLSKTPRLDKSKINSYKTTIVKTLIKNHKALITEIS